MTIQAKRRQWNAVEFRSIALAQARSGFSVQAYCRRKGINLSSFYRWQSRAADDCTARAKSRRTMAVTATPVSAEFIELGSMPATAPRLELRFDLGNGVSLTVLR